MSPRAYRLGQREAALRNNQERILQAAAALLASKALHNISMDEIAQQADVARATVYKQYGSKLRLLDALMEYMAQKAGIQLVHQAVLQQDSRQALRDFLRTIAHFWLAVRPVARNIFGLGLMDEEVDALVRSKDEGRRMTITHLVERLRQDGHLPEDVAITEQVDMLWVLSSFHTFEHLHSRSSLDGGQVGRILVDMAERSLFCRQTG